MTKSEILTTLNAVAGDTEYGREVIADLENKPFESDAKYHQDAQDRLDERLGTLKMWVKKDQEKGDTAKAEADEANIAILEKMIASLK